jgi:hypothetical protein
VTVRHEPSGSELGLKLGLIFDLLDSDGDGLVSTKKMGLQRLPDALVNLLVPLFLEMNELNAVLSKKSFTAAGIKLYESLSSVEKGNFLRLA